MRLDLPDSIEALSKAIGSKVRNENTMSPVPQSKTCYCRSINHCKRLHDGSTFKFKKQGSFTRTPPSSNITGADALQQTNLSEGTSSHGRLGRGGGPERSLSSPKPRWQSAMRRCSMLCFTNLMFAPGVIGNRLLHD